MKTHKLSITEYTKFISDAAEHPTPELARYHAAMVRAFQHERAIHLAVTFFFVAMTLIVIGLSCWLSLFIPWFYLLPLYLIAIILFCVSIAYVAFYYHLENSVQNLYFFYQPLLNPQKSPSSHAEKIPRHQKN